MADTLLAVVKRVLISTGQDSSVTAFSDNDDTNYIVLQINAALLELRTLKATHLDNNATISIVANTRLYSVATGLDVYDIDPSSFRLENVDIGLTTLESLKDTDTEYDTRTSEKVSKLYYEDGKIGVYPLLQTGSSAQTLKYRHPDVWARLSATTDVFPYPDPNWISYCEQYAQYKYEIFKGIGNPADTASEVSRWWNICTARAISSENTRTKTYRRFSR